MKAVHGAIYAFHPDSYMLPREYTKFIGKFTKLQQQVLVRSSFTSSLCFLLCSALLSLVGYQLLEL